MSQVPFSTFNGYLKAIRADALTSSQLAATRLAFPGFYEEPKANPIDVERHELKKKDPSSLPGNLQSPFTYRRFAGGPDLPRARYYSVCIDASGHDHQTLASELMAYLDPKQSGEVNVLDLSDPGLSKLCAYYTSLWPNAGEFEKTVVAIFYSRPGIPTPFVEKHTEATGDPTGRMKEVTPAFPVFFPTQVTSETITKCIDIRLPEVQNWLYSELRKGIPNVVYYYSGAGVKKELALDESSQMLVGKDNPDPHEKMVTGTDTVLRFASFPEGKKVLNETNGTFSDLVPMLMSYFKGGSPVTDTIGVWLRRLGANALIFPSSRTDPFCKIVNGRFDTARGFNLVDFREAPPPPSVATLIEEPVSWAELKFGVSLVCGVPGGIYEGSWETRGNFDATRSQARYEAELYYQAHYSNINPEYANKKFMFQSGKNWVGPVLITELKASLASGIVSLFNNVKKDDEIPHNQENYELGNLLANSTIPVKEDYLEKEVCWGGSWFLHQWGKWDDEILLHCPICDHTALYPFARGYQVYSKCPVCSFSNGNAENGETIRTRILEQSVLYNQRKKG